MKIPVTYFFNLAVSLDVHIDCDSMTGPGLPGRGVPSAQEVLDYIKLKLLKFFKSAGPCELKRVKSKEQNVQCSGATNSLEEEFSPVIEAVPQKKDTTVGHGESENESTSSRKLVNLDIKVDCSEATGARESPSAQEFLNLIADTYVRKMEPSSQEEFNSFMRYMEQVRQLVVTDIKTGSLIITAICNSLEILDELWIAHCTGTLNKMAQSLVTEDVLITFGLTEMKLITTIVEEDYEACREVFLKEGAGGYILWILSHFFRKL